MRPGAVFVNVGRGDLVDEAALVDALASAASAAPGSTCSPPSRSPPTAHCGTCPNVIITPHSSANTPDRGDGAAEIFLANLARYARGEPLHNER